MAYGLADVVQQRRLIEQSEASDEYKRVVERQARRAARPVRDRRLPARACCSPISARRARPAATATPASSRRETWDATDAAQKALSAIYRTGQRFGAGAPDRRAARQGDTERVAPLGPRPAAVFGVGADLDEAAWRGVFRQLVALGLRARRSRGARRAASSPSAAGRCCKGEQPSRCAASSRAARAAARPRGAPRAATCPPADAGAARAAQGLAARRGAHAGGARPT